MPGKIAVILCTCPDRASADVIAQALVRTRLAACVNELPGVTSTYRWDGKVCREEEIMLIIKTDMDYCIQVEQCIADLHPNELPEVIAMPVTGGSQAYLDWVTSSLQKPATGRPL